MLPMLRDLMTLFWCLAYLVAVGAALISAYVDRWDISTFLLVLALHLGGHLDHKAP